MKAKSSAFPSATPKNRLVGDLPKIGIRPAIDGRRGKARVRENLEEQTMAMAVSVKNFLEANLKHTCGLPVECVIADTTIGAWPSRRPARRSSAGRAWAFPSTVTPCWCTAPRPWDMDL